MQQADGLFTKQQRSFLLSLLLCELNCYNSLITDVVCKCLCLIDVYYSIAFRAYCTCTDSAC